MLVTPGHVQNGAAVRPFLLLKKKGPVRRTQQAVGAGNHIKLVVCLLLSGVVYQQETDTAIIGKAFQCAHHLVVVGIAVLVSASLPDFLEGVNDNQLGIGVFPDKHFELSLQANAELFSVDCKEQVVGAVHAEHPIQPPLQSAVVVLQRQIEDGALVDGVAPQGEAHAHMIGKLGHQERLAHLGRSRKEVRPRVEQTVNDWRSALVDILVKLTHGNGGEIGRVGHAAHFQKPFLQTFLLGVVFGSRF